MRGAVTALIVVVLALVADHFLQGGYLRRQIVFQAQQLGYAMQHEAKTAIRHISP